MDIIKIDTKGMDCPLPLMELKKALEGAETGQMIEVVFTCPEATVNIPDYCERHDIEIIDYQRDDNKFWKIIVRK